MIGRAALKLVAPFAAFMFSLGAAAPGAMNRPCRMDVSQSAASGGQTGPSGGGATCCCDRAEASHPAAVITQHERSTLGGAGGAAAYVAQSAFWLTSSAGSLHQNLTSLDPGSRIPLLLITRSLLI